MKAAIYTPGEVPKYGDFPEPTVQNENQILITVKAAAVKNLDKGIVSGHHYSSSDHKQLKVAGMDGVGELADGTRVYGLGIGGTIAEKALIDKRRMIKIPAGVDDVTAAALPNAIMGAGAAICYRAGMKAGDVVLINGATGVTGMVAVQIAKHNGAKKIIVTGRNPDTLNHLLTLGADDAIWLKQDDESIIHQIKELHAATPIDVIIDYLWGHPAELIFAALTGKGGHSHQVRFVTVGGMAGDKIQLSSGTLRSSDIQLMGSGLGSLPEADMEKMFTQLIPEMFGLAASGKLKIGTVTASIKDVETTWKQDVPPGKRLVILV
jgi:NADPH:quinone reductase-like Zn-dependent oxidoreductase